MEEIIHGLKNGCTDEKVIAEEIKGLMKDCDKTSKELAVIKSLFAMQLECMKTGYSPWTSRLMEFIHALIGNMAATTTWMENAHYHIQVHLELMFERKEKESGF